ncbi:MAG: hypothetical protein QXU32_00890 [Nitrososphaerales archaeon]
MDNQKLTGQLSLYTDSKSNEDHYTVTGSIFGGTGPNSIILDAGFANIDDPFWPHKEIIAMRGPLSRDKTP